MTLLAAIVVLSTPLATCPKPCQSQIDPPRLNATFQENTKIGFKVKVPKDWHFIAPTPEIDGLLARFDNISKADLSPPKVKVGASLILVKASALSPASRKDAILEILTNYARIIRGDFAGDWKIVEGLADAEASFKAKKNVVAEVFEYALWNEGNEVVANAIVFVLANSQGEALLYMGYGDAGQVAWNKHASKWTRGAETFSFQKLKKSKPEDHEFLAQLGLESKYQDIGWKDFPDSGFVLASLIGDKKFEKQISDRASLITKAILRDYAMENLEGRRLLLRVFKYASGRSQYCGEYHTVKSLQEWCQKHNEILLVDNKTNFGGSTREDIFKHLANDLVPIMLSKSLEGNPAHDWFFQGNTTYYSNLVLNGKRPVSMACDCHSGVLKRYLKGASKIDLSSFLVSSQLEWSMQTGGSAGDYEAIAWSFVSLLHNDQKGGGPELARLLPSYAHGIAAGSTPGAALSAALNGISWEDLQNAWDNWAVQK